MINGHDNNLVEGYVKLYRSIKKKAWYKKSEFVHLFIHLLIKASHSGYETWLNGASKMLNPGQLVTGRKKLSDETGIDQHKIDRILKCFETEQQIKQQTFNTCRLISIINWDSYQNIEQRPAQRLSNRRATDEQQVSTIQEGKEGKKMEKNERVNGTHTQILKIGKNDQSKYSQDDIEIFNSYQSWIQENAAEVLKMKEPLTIQQFILFQKQFPGGAGQKLFEKVLIAMDNYQLLHNKRSAYKTIISWIKNEKYDQEIIKLRDTCKAEIAKQSQPRTPVSIMLEEKKMIL